MSNAQAISAVTATLASMIGNRLVPDFEHDPELEGYLATHAEVTTVPPDRAREGHSGNQLNLFLYHVAPNAAWRNLDMPTQTRAGEQGHPPLALDLYYLLTAYGAGDNDLAAHQLLGRAMRVLNDYPVLMAGDIPDGTGPAGSPPDMRWSGLAEQVERIRIVPHAMPMEELSRLWQTFQTQYRVSTAWRASVVLIESRRPTRASLPVLRRGAEGAGVSVQPSLDASRFPRLTALVPPGAREGVVPGDVLRVRGDSLDGTVLQLKLEGRGGATRLLPVARGVDGVTLTVTMPTDETAPPAGVYLASAVVTRGLAPPITTHALPLLAMPAIVGAPAVGLVDGRRTVTVSCAPPVGAQQRVSLLLDATEVPAASVAPGAAPRSSVAFDVDDLPPRAYLARLRVDGVDSLMVDRSATPPVFAAPTVTLS